MDVEWCECSAVEKKIFGMMEVGEEEVVGAVKKKIMIIVMELRIMVC